MRAGHSVNYLWELQGIPAQDSLPALKAEFTVQHRLCETSDWQKFSFQFDIIDYVVLFITAHQKGNAIVLM